MAKNVYEGVSGVARKVKKIYEGVSNVAREMKNGYIGVGSVARQFFQDSLVLFDYGTADNNISLYSKNAEYGTNCIDFASGYILSYNGTINMSEYTMFCMYVKVSWLEKDYVNFKLEFSGDVYGTDSAHYSVIEEKYYTVKIPLSTTRSGGFGIRISNTSSANKGTTGGVNGKIYKIWFE